MLLNQKLSGQKTSNNSYQSQTGNSYLATTDVGNDETQSYISRNSPMQQTNFKLNVKRAPSINKTVDYSTMPSSHGLPSIHRNDNTQRTLLRDKSTTSYKSQHSHYGHEGSIITIKNSNPMGGNMLPSLYGVEDFNQQLIKFQQEIQNSQRSNADLEQKLKDSEHKRHEHLRKNLELQKKILELENQIKQLQQRFKDLMLKKASGILREQFQELELAHTKALKDLKEYKDKDAKFVARIEAVKITLKQQNEKYRDAMEQERNQMMKQIDNYKLLVAELRTEISLSGHDE
eukprot:403333243